MENYEIFKQRNAAFGAYYIPKLHEEEMQKCYEIAKHVERTYEENYGHIMEPKIGDIVEFSDGWRVYDHAKIVENHYGGSKYGMVCVCEQGSSHTDGKGFSTSGGAFKAFHKSRLELVGEDVNVVWTWGCYGSGAHQGIYFPLKVRRWRVPYDVEELKRSRVTIRGRGAKSCNGSPLSAVSIENTDSFYTVKTFCSLGAFKAWAKYVGYQYRKVDSGWGARQYVSRQTIVDKCYTQKDWQPPVGAKPIKTIANGRLRDGWVVTTDDAIITYWPNIYDPEHPEPKYGTPEYEAEMREYHKYSGNPMGVEIR